MRFIHTLAALGAALAMLAPAAAHEKSWAAPMLGTSESPSVTTTGYGQARVTVDFDLMSMRVEFSFSDLIGKATAAHIHCCTAVANSGNVGVATMTPSFTNFSFAAGVGPQSGSYDRTFDMALASSYNAAFITAKDTTPADPTDNLVLAFNALVAGLDDGKAYLNLHTTSFPGGEIRGLLAPVPEAQTYALMLVGLGAIGWAARRQRRG
jgi:CHRD domain/PEP-CTERM motif